MEDFKVVRELKGQIGDMEYIVTESDEEVASNSARSQEEGREEECFLLDAREPAGYHRPESSSESACARFARIAAASG